MLINLRNALMTGKRLPYDAEIEYLESTGTQWIDTGLTSLDVDTIFEATFAMRSVPANVNSLFGADSILTGSQMGKIALTQMAMSANTFYTTKLVYTVNNNRQIYVNGEFAATASNYHKVYPIRLFALAAQTYTTGSFLISGVKITMGGVLVRDYIPVRKGTVGYLYDRVSGKLFGNAGSGDFVLGQDVVPVEYIESHGTEYIAMGIAGNALSRIDIGIEKTETNGTRRFVVGSNRDPNASIGSSTYFDVNTSGYFGQNSNGFACTVGQWYNLSIRADGYYSDGVKVYSPSFVFPLRPSVELFLLSLGTATGGRWVGRVSYLKAWDTNGNLAQDLLPVRVGTEGAMMDVLTRRIYRNQGTGAFTYGNDLKYPIPAA